MRGPALSEETGGDPIHEVKAHGVRIAYGRAGQGPPLVLLHGGPLDAREWRHQLKGLSDEFTVLAWDMPGCSRSDDPPERFRTRDYADCLASFIAALGRPHVLGLSFGSGLALELYRWHPDLPRSLVLASAYAGWAGSLPPRVAEQRQQRMLQMIELPPDQWAREWIPTLLTSAASAEVVDEVTTILADFHPAGQRALLRSGFAEHDLRNLLPQIAVPTLGMYPMPVLGPRPTAAGGTQPGPRRARRPGRTAVVTEGCRGHGAAMSRRASRTVPSARTL